MKTDEQLFAREDLRIAKKKSKTTTHKDDNETSTVDLIRQLNPGSEDVGSSRIEMEMPELEITASAPSVKPSKADIRKIKKANRQIVKEASPEEKTAVVAEVEKKPVEEVVKETPNNKKLDSKFMSALEFLAPNAVGMLVGGLIGGARGAVEGQQRGGALGQGLTNHLRQEKAQDIAEMNAETQRMYAERRETAPAKKSISKDWVTSSGDPVWTSPEGGLTDMHGNPVSDVKRYTQPEKGMTEYQRRSLELQANKQVKQQDSLALKEYKKSVGRGIAESAKSTSRVSADISTLDNIIEELSEKGSMQSFLPGETTRRLVGSKAQLFQDQVNKIVAGDIKKTFGGNISDGEREFVVGVNYKATGKDKDNIAKLTKLRDVMKKAAHFDQAKRLYLEETGDITGFDEYYYRNYPENVSKDSPLAKKYGGFKRKLRFSK